MEKCGTFSEKFQCWWDQEASMMSEVEIICKSCNDGTKSALYVLCLHHAAVLPKENLLGLSPTEWLATLHLEIYTDNFLNNFFTTMERILAVWDDELTSILEIDKMGHRKRILLSVSGSKEGLMDRFGKVVHDDQGNNSIKRHKRLFEETMEVDPPVFNEETPKLESKSKVEDVPMDNSPVNIDLEKLPPPGSPETSRRSPRTKLEQPKIHSPIPPPTPPKPKLSSVRSSSSSTSSPSHHLPMDSSSSNSRPSSSKESKGKSPKPDPGSTGTKKKKSTAPMPPKTKSKPKSAVATPKEAPKKANLPSEERPLKPEEKRYLSYKVKYYGKRLIKDFKGTDSTKIAIETGKKAKSGSANSGKPRYVVLSERSIKIIKRDTKELVTKHSVNGVCCVVRDSAEPTFFGYITTDPMLNNQKFSHVFSTECVGKTSEILMVICDGFSAALSKVKSFHQDPIQDHGTLPKPTPNPVHNPPPQPQKSKSDHIVSRMKMFFQSGGSFVGVASSGRAGADGSGSRSPPKSRRKRGGSMDNLLEDLDCPTITKETKQKSLSSKNLSSGLSVEEVKITTV